MTDANDPVLKLARDLIALDSRSSVSNLAVADRIEAELAGFEVERIDYVDAADVAKRALVAHRGVVGGRSTGGLAFSGHMDTVPATGWTDDPWRPEIKGGSLRGLGSADMKGPLAAAIVAAQQLPVDVPVTLIITTDEETTKAGARQVVERSELVRRAAPRLIVVNEPTGMVPIRGHRAHVEMMVTATGVQAHSSTGAGRNANWELIPFLAAARRIHDRLRADPALQDPSYDPPFSDYNLILDNHGTVINVTVPLATARIKFRYSARVDPRWVVESTREAAEEAGLTFEAKFEGEPPELAADHPLVRLCCEVAGAEARTVPFGTDASQLQAIAPCVILGPGDIANAHRPGESIDIAELVGAVPRFAALAARPELKTISGAVC